MAHLAIKFRSIFKQDEWIRTHKLYVRIYLVPSWNENLRERFIISLNLD